MVPLDEEELQLVLNETAQAMGGRGAFLSLHPDDGELPHVVQAGGRQAGLHDAVRPLVKSGMFWPSPDPGDVHRWNEGYIDTARFISLSVPVQRVSGHSRLVVTILFGELTIEDRARAEQVYLNRRPFAIGYFRLWQVARSREKQLLALRTALNLNDMGVALLGRSSRIIFANDTIEDIIAAGDGLCRRRKCIAASDLADNIKLSAAIEHVVADEKASSKRSAPLFRIRRLAQPPLVVAVLPTDQPTNEPDDVAAIMFVIDPARSPEQLLQPICKLFRLSPLETRLVCLLTSGATLQEAAGSLRLKEQTARSYLKQIFLKTDTNRQSDLIRTMLTNVVRTNLSVQTEVL